MSDLARVLDAVAAAAFPAIENVDLDGWVMRASGRAPWGRTRSVWTVRAGHSLSLHERLAAVRDFYDGRHYPPLVMVCDHSEPSGLTAALVADGWRCWDGAQVQVVTRLPDLRGRQWERAATSAVSTDAWAAAAAELQGWDVDTARANDELLARTPGEVIGVAATAGGSIVGLGRGVVTDGWLGIFGMITRVDHRRAGVGASVLAELFRHGARVGAEGAYLQVERKNTAALALYAAAGFSAAYDYDYWAPSEAPTRDSYC